VSNWQCEYLSDAKDGADAIQAGQIQALYSLLHFQDRPLDPRSTRQPVRAHVKGAPRDVLRMVRETLGDDAVRRLEEDGVTMGRRRSARLI
jgi:hypothetical protein